MSQGKTEIVYISKGSRVKNEQKKSLEKVGIFFFTPKLRPFESFFGLFDMYSTPIFDLRFFRWGDDVKARQSSLNGNENSYASGCRSLLLFQTGSGNSSKKKKTLNNSEWLRGGDLGITNDSYYFCCSDGNASRLFIYFLGAIKIEKKARVLKNVRLRC